MLINYVPGEECRVAVVSDNKLQALHVERTNAVSHVGNIYLGKVVNVEPSIQAAFIDFGADHNGFLHISDLHPQYFPSQDEDATERIGKKTPHRQRPPIQAALKKGQRLIVQVLKEGIGTKGPTLTSYLSIPGRCLVMLPQMDRVGVSRKVEDEELRRKMRQTLDQLELPEGFGFILRTAGIDRSKAELKRDLAYLNRLWKDMQRRLDAGEKPRLLYAESDLLLRALRDMLTTDVDEIVIDDVSALRRAHRFLKIFAPRSAPKLLHYDADVPMFHAFGVEEQIKSIHARRAPLPSGGYLIIDETEALVAIDVNSGRMRSHGDAETTAYKTNIEAVDEICRQLRLRDLGGQVVLDLIDMRSRAHRRDVEQRLRAELKKDNARSKALPISQFGMVELTRQRMRGSHRSAHFSECPACEGTGLVQRPDSVANEAVRDLTSLLQHERVHKVELVVSPRVASELLSTKRRRINRIEWMTGKRVNVRVSETIPVDRVTFHAYDDRDADVDIERLPALEPPTDLKQWTERGRSSKEDWAVDTLEEASREAAELERRTEEEIARAEAEAHAAAPLHPLEKADEEGIGEQQDGGGGKKRRRRRRRKRQSSGDQQSEQQVQDESGQSAERQAESAKDADDASTEKENKPARGRKRGGRRRRRGGKQKTEQRAEGDQQTEPKAGEDESPTRSEQSPDEADDGAPTKGTAGPSDSEQASSHADGERKKKKRGRRGGRRKRKKSERDAESPAASTQAESSEPAPEGPPRIEVDPDAVVQPAAAVFPPRGDSWDLDPVVVAAGEQADAVPTPTNEPARDQSEADAEAGGKKKRRKTSSRSGRTGSPATKKPRKTSKKTGEGQPPSED